MTERSDQSLEQDDDGNETWRFSINGVEQTRQNLNFRVAAAIQSEVVAKAFANVDRAKFVPARFKLNAYVDGPIPIGNEASVSQPVVIAKMIEALDLKGRENILEVGTASGYTAAILSQIGSLVHTIEYQPELAHEAENRLRALGYSNVIVHLGDGALGWANAAPYDAIIVTAAVKDFPRALVIQLAEGRRIVAPVGTKPENTFIRAARKLDGRMQLEIPQKVSFYPLVSEHHGAWSSLEEFKEAYGDS